jgi:hypothetical protein
MKSKSIIAADAYLRLRPKDVALDSAPVYEFYEVERKNIQNLVSATGTLAAREIVEIGTQVFGDR